jgi:hypothetical protein
VTVTLWPENVERATKLAEALTANPDVTRPGDSAWTVQDVVNTALARGLDAMEQTYLTDRP